ncbi:hypothetical protein Q5C_01345 [Leuconostoc pseudomesenteroides 4882]|nr:hypothetical protein Q5C_01345 [Leuconostoc pseudomesenteroides 4882]
MPLFILIILPYAILQLANKNVHIHQMMSRERLTYLAKL